MNKDKEHLRILAIFYFIFGGLAVLGGCIPFLHLGIGIAMVSGAFPTPPNGPPVPASLGWVFIVIATLVIVLSWALAAGQIVTGRLLLRQKGYTFCLVMATITCLGIPFGTVLGIFTFIVLNRPSVKSLFNRQKTQDTGWQAELT